MASFPLNQRASGTPVAGVVTLSFPACPTGRIWQGTVVIPGAAANDSWQLTIGGQLMAIVIGSGPFGPVQVQTGQVLSLVGTITLGTPYVAVLVGIDDPIDDPSPYTGPAALPATTIATTTTAAQIEATFTAAGQIYQGTGAGTGEQFAPGAAGTFLESQGAGQPLVWSTPPLAPTVYTQRSSAATLAAGEMTQLNASSGTFTMPASPPTGTVNTIFNAGSTVTLAQQNSGFLGYGFPSGGLVSTISMSYAQSYTFVYSNSTGYWLRLSGP